MDMADLKPVTMSFVSSTFIHISSAIWYRSLSGHGCCCLACVAVGPDLNSSSQPESGVGPESCHIGKLVYISILNPPGDLTGMSL